MKNLSYIDSVNGLLLCMCVMINKASCKIKRMICYKLHAVRLKKGKRVSEFSNLRDASVSDVQLLVNLEHMQENNFVNRNSVKEHTDAILNNPDMIYLIAESSTNDVLGYAILFHEDMRRIEFRRVVIIEKGKGLGTVFIRAILDHIFERYDAQKIWLDVYEENKRAQHLYRKVGFEISGETREQISPEFGKLIVMELHRDYYQERQG